MPNLNINWKGYPHHFPRIRLASSPQASFHATAPHIAARNVFAAPLSTILEETRESQRLNSKRRRRRSIASITRARKRASRKARQEIQVFGWDSPRAMNTRTESTESFGSDTSGTVINWTPPPISKPTASAVQTPRRESVYSLMQVAERNVQVDKAGKVLVDSSREYAHTRPVEMVSPKDAGEGLTINRGKTYDPRITFTKPRSRSRKASTSRRPIARRASIVSNASSRSAKRLRKSPTRSSLKQNTSKATRTAKERKRLNRYIKELELYIQATNVLPNHKLVPSYSPTTPSAASIHTIQALKPYQAQFESAGLAVTSADQLNNKPLRKISMSPPPTPPKDQKWRHMSASHAFKSDAGSAGSHQKAGAERITTIGDQGAVESDITLKPSPKKSLPWLKKKNSALVPSSVPEHVASEKIRPQSPISSSPSMVISFSPDKTIEKQIPEIPSRPPPIPPKEIHPQFEKAQVIVDMTIESAKEAKVSTNLEPKAGRSQNVHKMVDMIKESVKQPDHEHFKPATRAQESQVMTNMLIESLEEAKTVTPRTEDRIREAQRLVDRIMESAKRSRLLDGRATIVKRTSPKRALLGRQRRPFSNLATPVTSDEADWIDDLDEEVSDMAVIKGLYIATAAASDEHIDMRIKFTTGIAIRKFLADLASLDKFCTGLGTEEQSARESRRNKGKGRCDSFGHAVDERHNNCTHPDQELEFAGADLTDHEHVPPERQQNIRDLNETVDRLAKWNAVKATEGYGAGCGYMP